MQKNYAFPPNQGTLYILTLPPLLFLLFHDLLHLLRLEQTGQMKGGQIRHCSAADQKICDQPLPEAVRCKAPGEEGERDHVQDNDEHRVDAVSHGHQEGLLHHVKRLSFIPGQSGEGVREGRHPEPAHGQDHENKEHTEGGVPIYRAPEIRRQEQA